MLSESKYLNTGNSGLKSKQIMMTRTFRNNTLTYLIIF